MNRPLPTVEVVDMRAELAHGNRSVFSAPLLSALRACMERGEQAMLLMNRRGYHAFVSCRACGHVMKCPNCDVAMTYHVSGGDGQLHCHYCGCQLPAPGKVSRLRQRLSSATSAPAPSRWRRPCTSSFLACPWWPAWTLIPPRGKDGHQRLLDDFRSGRSPHALVGTQMIAKGLDFPRVTLVGVVAADMTLNLPDYRARERTFQLLTQVAGPGGPGATSPVRCSFRPTSPRTPCIQAAARQDYRSFFEEEFSRRRTGLYPPFTLLARLLVEGREDQRAQEPGPGAVQRPAAPSWRSIPPGASGHAAFAGAGRRAGEVSPGQKPATRCSSSSLFTPDTDAFLGEVYRLAGAGEKRGHRYLV